MSVFNPTTRLALLLAILLLGAAVRIAGLDTRSLWADEGWTVLLSEGPGVRDVTLTMVKDQHPPLFFVLLRGWRNLTGDSAFALRYFSLLIGVVAVALTYQLGRSLFSPLAGVIAALLLALADLHIDLSQEVRHYALLATFVILSSVAYARWWRDPTRTNRVAYVLASLALLYTHYLGGYVLIAQLLHLLLAARPRARLRDGLVLFGAICLGFLPWFPVVLAQNSVRWDNPLYYQNALANSVETYRMVRDAVLGKRFALLLVPVALGVIHVSYRRAGDRQRAALRLRPWWPVAYLALWIGLMVGLTVALNAQREFLTVRNFILIIPPVLVLAGRGLTNVPRSARLFTLALLVVVGLTTVDARRSYPDWDAVARTVSDHYVGDETILLDVWVGDFPLRYYLDRHLPDAPWVSLREWRDTYRAQFLPTLLGQLQQVNAFWLVYWGDDPLHEYGHLIEQTGFQRMATLRVDHQGTPIYSYRYDKLPDTTLARFGDLFALQRFHARHPAMPGAALTVSLWWTALQPPPLDYSVSVFLLNDAGELVAQHDGPPLAGAVPTSAWSPGMLQYDTHRIALPASLPPGGYQLGVKIYWYGDNQPLPVTMAGQPTGDFAPLATMTFD